MSEIDISPDQRVAAARAKRAFWLAAGSCLLPILGLALVIPSLIFAVMGVGRSRKVLGRASLCIVMAGIGLVLQVSLAIALLDRRDGIGHRNASCMANLSAIGKGLIMYADSNGGFPLLMAAGNPNAHVSQETAANDVFDPTLGSNAMQNIWLMVRNGDISMDAFRCPVDKNLRKRTTWQKYGWTSPNEFSYGMHWPYDRDTAGRKNAAPLSDLRGNSRLVIMTEGNQGGWANRHLTTHGQAFLPILRRDGSVDSLKEGMEPEDDWYSNRSGEVGGLPQSPLDSSITPGRHR